MDYLEGNIDPIFYSVLKFTVHLLVSLLTLMFTPVKIIGMKGLRTDSDMFLHPRKDLVLNLFHRSRSERVS